MGGDSIEVSNYHRSTYILVVVLASYMHEFVLQKKACTIFSGKSFIIGKVQGFKLWSQLWLCRNLLKALKTMTLRSQLQF